MENIVKNKFFKILSSITLAAISLSIVLLTVLTIMNVKSSDSPTENTLDRQLTYNLDNKISEDYLDIRVLDSNAKTAVFIGIKKDAAGLSPANLVSTLVIPETINISGQDYTVTEVNTDDSRAEVSNVDIVDSYLGTIHPNSLWYYGSNITALVLPSTITKINDGAFFGMAALEYLETPFIGLEAYTSTYTGVKYPLHKMFSHGYYNTVDISTYGNYHTIYQPEYQSYNDNTKLSKLIDWHEKETVTTGSLIHFRVPYNLSVVNVTGGTNFGPRAFLNFKTLTSVTLPESLLAMGDYAFQSCESLVNVNIPSKMTTLPNGMFSSCKALESLSIPYGTTSISTYAFNNCISLEDVRIPSTITVIDNGAFSGCEDVNLQIRLYSGNNPENVITPTDPDVKVSLPDGLQRIGNNAFEYVRSIKKLAVPSSEFTEMGKQAFKDCVNMTDITIPFVGYHKGIISQEEINNDIDNLKGANNFGWIFGTSSIANTYACNQNGSQHYIPSSLATISITNETEIASMALGNLRDKDLEHGVSSISINKEVYKVEAGAMAGSNFLTTLTLPFVGASVFPTNSSYNQYAKHELGQLFYFDDNFVDKSVLTNNAATNATRINQNGRKYYVPNNLTTIIIKNLKANQNTIYTGSFAEMAHLEEVEISKDVTYIESAIFFKNNELTKLTLPFVGYHRGEKYEYWWWWYDYMQYNLFSWVFSYETQLGITYEDRSIAWYDRYVRKIPNKLYNVTITDETIIGEYAFKNLTSLTDLTILDGGQLSQVRFGSCYNCHNLERLTLPWIGYDKNEPYSYDGASHTVGYIFGTKEYTNSYLAQGYDNYYIPNSLTSITINHVSRIPAYSFANFRKVSTITFNSDVTEVGPRAFYMNSNLSTINYPYSANGYFTTVGDYAFNGCSKILHINEAIPQYAGDGGIILGNHAFGYTSISEIDFTKFDVVGDYAFEGSKSLISVDVTSNISSFGDGVFADCSYLKNVTLSTNQATRYLFKNCVSIEDIDISNAIKDYKLPEGIFYGCKNLKWDSFDPNKGVKIGTQVTSIGAYAFANCTGLTNFTIPQNVKSIGNYAFNGCDNLEEIYIPKDTTVIGDNVFTENIPKKTGQSFVIWVYYPEEKWPVGWNRGWNCVNPVMVIPGNDDSIYTYDALDSHDDINGYVISGIKDIYINYVDTDGLVHYKSDFILRSVEQVRLPQTHNGINVVGIRSNVFNGLDNIKRFIIPSTYQVIGGRRVTTEDVTYRGTFDTGVRADLYFEHSLDQAPVLFDSNELNKTTEKLNNSISLHKITYGGYAFFGDMWSYGKADDVTPYINISSIAFDLDEGINGLTYIPNYAQTPEVEFATLPGFALDNNNVFDDDYPMDLVTTLFNYSYKDNIASGTASMVAELDKLQYDYEYGSLDYPLYFTGTGGKNFTIHKQGIVVLKQADGSSATFNKSFDDEKFEKSSWNVDEVSILQDDQKFTFTGTLSTRSKNAGTYTLTDAESNDEVYWSDKWNVYYDGVNVSKNYTVKVYVVMNIQPKPVVLEWTGGYGMDNVGGTPCYQYGYNGKDGIKIQAVAKANGVVVEDCKITIDTTYYNGASAIVVGDKAHSIATASSTNYTALPLESDIIVVPRRLKIKFRDPNYQIPVDAESFSFENWADASKVTFEEDITKVQGLPNGTALSGRLISVDENNNKSKVMNATYQSVNGDHVNNIIWEKQNFVVFSDVLNLDYLFARYDANGNLELNENDYYTIVNLDAKVVMKYNTFDVKYFIGTTDYTEGPDTDPNYVYQGNTYTRITYRYNGRGEVPFTAQVVNDSLIGNLIQPDVIYKYDGIADPVNGTTEPYKIKALKTTDAGTIIEIEISRDNFVPAYYKILLNVIKCDIKYADITREYNGEPIDLGESPNYDKFILDCDDEKQLGKITVKFLDKNKSEIEAPSVPGDYYVRVVAPEGNFFNGTTNLDGGYYDYPFKILKKVINIYVDRSEFLNPNIGGTNVLISSTPYTGSNYGIVVNTNDGSVTDEIRHNAGLVGDHHLIGTVYTRDAIPGIYTVEDINPADNPTGKHVGDWFWLPTWDVRDFANSTSVRDYYDVKLVGKFEITNLQFEYHVIPDGDEDLSFDANNRYEITYDGGSHFVDVVVTKPTVGVKKYYMLGNYEVPVWDDEQKKLVDNNPWKDAQYFATNFYFTSPGEYTVSYKIAADNYETIYGTRVILINYDLITFDDPIELEPYNNTYIIDYDTFNHSLAVGNVYPFSAEVRYTLYIRKAGGDYEYYKEYPGGDTSLDPITYVNTTTVPVVSQLGDYKLVVTVSAIDYQDKSKEYIFSVSENRLTVIPSTDVSYQLDELAIGVTTVTFDGLAHSIKVNYPAYLDGKNPQVYFQGTNGEWATTSPAKVNAGSYTINYKIKANGYKTYSGVATFKIEPDTMTGISVSVDAHVYDGKSHTFELTGVPDGATVYYTTVAELTTLDPRLGGWSTTQPTRTNVGVTSVFIHIIKDNFEDYPLGPIDIVITKNTDPLIEYTDGLKIQYKKKAIEYADLKITTCHDGLPLVKYYAGKFSGDTIVKASATPLNFDPYDLGPYFVEVSYTGTDNCSPKTVSFGIEIVKRKVKPVYKSQVEYTGEGQNPVVTVDSGTGDKLEVFITRKGSSAAPVDIGKYYYQFTFTTPQVYYELELPEEYDDINYPYEFEITTIKLLIQFTDSMPYDYGSYKIWKKNSDWAGIQSLSKLLNNHTYHAEMQTNNYVQGKYFYTSDSVVEYSNKVLISNDRILDKNGIDVSFYYEITYDIMVHIYLPSLVVTVDESPIVYDGEAHGLRVSVPNNVKDVTYYYATEANYALDTWTTTPITYREVNEYYVWLWIDSGYYEPYIKKHKIKIVKTPLNIEVNDYEATYDDDEHHASHDVTNVTNINGTYYTKYYRADEYTEMQLAEYYGGTVANTDSIFVNGLDKMVDAGEYLVVVYYPVDGNWYQSFGIGHAKINQRPIQMDLKFKDDYIKDKDYDGDYYYITMGTNAVLDSNLVYTHKIYRSANSRIRTVSPDADTYYGATGFDFDPKTIKILSDDGRNVTLNYKPIVLNTVEITIHQIELTQLDVFDNEMYYDGTPAKPIVVTPSDGTIIYVWDKWNPNKGVNGGWDRVTEINACGVGKYRVYVSTTAGKNYKAWDKTNPSAIVIIKPRVTQIIWEDLELEFNGQFLSPKAYFIDENDVRVDMLVKTRNDQGVLVEADELIASNYYEVYAVFIADVDHTESNYSLENGVEIFRIKPVEYVFTLEEITNISTREWFKEYNMDNVGTEIDGNVFVAGKKINNVTITNEAGNDDAKVTTISSNPGTYNQSNDFNYSDFGAIAEVGGVNYDVSSSFTFKFNGSVTIISNNVVVSQLKEEIVYDKMAHKIIGEIIDVTEPQIRDKSGILWHLGTDNGYANDNPNKTEMDAGTYTYYYQAIYDEKEDHGVVTFKILPKTPFIKLKDGYSLDRVYDAAQVKPEEIRDNIIGEFNGSKSELVFTFYRGDSNVPLPAGTYPIDAGIYRLVITSTADGNLDYKQNYEPLSDGEGNYIFDYIFEIQPKVVDIVIREDYEVTNIADKFEYIGTTKIETSLPGVKSYNNLAYKFQATNNIPRGTYLYDGLIAYEQGKSSYEIITSRVDDETYVYPFSFTWNIYATDRDSEVTKEGAIKYVVGDKEHLDVSYNYSINLDYQLVLHYPYIELNKNSEIYKGAEFDYTGTPHYPDDSDSLNTPTESEFPGKNGKKLYGTTQNSLGFGIDLCGAADPGTHTIYYLYQCDGYEPLYGSVNYEIGYADREIQDNINFDKEYDGLEVGTNVKVAKQVNVGDPVDSSVGDVVILKGAYDDNVDVKNARIRYYLRNSKQELPTKPVNAGEYDYEIYIPQSSLYAETVIRKPFTITKKIIYVDGVKETGYLGRSIEYSDFTSADNPFKFYFSDGSLVPATIRVERLQLFTIGFSINNLEDADTSNDYYAYSKNTLNYSSDPRPRIIDINKSNPDVTSNYQIALTSISTSNPTGLINVGGENRVLEARIVIINGLISVVVKNPTFDYDGVSHPSSKSDLFTVTTEISYTVNYATSYDENTYQKGVDGKDPFKDNTTLPTQTNVRRDGGQVVPYVLYARISAPNYDDKIVLLQYTIKPAATTLTMSGFDSTGYKSLDYDGNAVIFPGVIETNNPNPVAKSTIYQVYDSANDKYDTLDAEYPKNAGRYKMIIAYGNSADGNIEGGSFEFIFDIKGVRTQLNWDKLLFEYNGYKQQPNAEFDFINPSDADNINKIYVVVRDPNDSDEDQVDPVNVGTYYIKLKLETLDKQEVENYEFAESDKIIRFTIFKKTLDVKLNRQETYNNGELFTFEHNSTGYSIDGLVVGHQVSAGSKLKTKSGAVGNYKNASDFEWTTDSGDIVILDFINHEGKGVTQENVTGNYHLNYDFKLNINFSQLKVKSSGGTYTYNASTSRSITVICENTFPDDQQASIKYATSFDGPYTATNPQFTDAGEYKVWYRVEFEGYEPINGDVDPYKNADCYEIIKINPLDAGLRFANANTKLGKQYDGVKVTNPTMAFNNPTLQQSDCTFTYKIKNNMGEYVIDPSSNGQYALNAGEYLLTVTLGATNNYKDGTFEYKFEIVKRKVSITLADKYTDRRVDKAYDGYRWIANLNNTNELNVEGLAPGHKFYDTKIQTVTANAREYVNIDDFEWTDEYPVIRSASDAVVTSNYDITYNLHVGILKGTFVLDPNTIDEDGNILPTSELYDGQGHTINVSVIVPQEKIYKVLYFAYPDGEETGSAPTDDQYSEEPIFRTTVGKTVVYVMIKDPNNNYVTKKTIGQIIINGRPLEADLVLEKTITYGKSYEHPQLKTVSNGAVTIKYLDASNNLVGTYYYATDTLEGKKPTEAGTYKVIASIDTDGVYSTGTFNGSFVIQKKQLTVDWTDANGNNSLVQTYTEDANGDAVALIPVAKVTDPLLTIDFDDAVNDTKTLVVASEHSLAGSYTVTATLTGQKSNNYELIDGTMTFTIKPMEVQIPDIKPDMVFRYYFTKTRTIMVDDEEQTTTYEFGDKVRDGIVDINGNLYILDEDNQTILKIKAPNGDETVVDLPYYFVLDGIDANNYTDADTNETHHTLRICLTNEAKVNKVWAVYEDIADKTFEYKVIPYAVSTATYNEDDVIITAKLNTGTLDNTMEYKDGEELRPTTTITVIKKIDGVPETIFTLTKDQEYRVDYFNNQDESEEVTDPSKKPRVMITGIYNFDIAEDLYFEIVSKAPDMFILNEDAKIIFMGTERTYGDVVFNEDENNERMILKQDSIDEYLDKKDIYLGHIHHATLIDDVLKQIANDREYIKVYKNVNGTLTLVESDYYTSEYVGTGMVFELYDAKKPDKLIDSIEAIVFGDIDGDGSVTAIDTTVYELINSGKLSYTEILSEGYKDKEDYLSVNFTTIAAYYATIIDRENGYLAPNPILTTLMYLYNAGTGDDFNGQYEL